MVKNKKFMVFASLLLVTSIILAGCGNKNSSDDSTNNIKSSEEVSSGDSETRGAEDGAKLSGQDIEESIGAMPSEDDPVELMHWHYKRDRLITKSISADSEGYYNYPVGDKIIPCSRNVWDYIDVRNGARGEYYVFRFGDLVESFGLTPIINEDASYGTEPLNVTGPYSCFIFDPSTKEISYGYHAMFISGRINDGDFNSAIYRVGSKDESWIQSVSLNSIIICAYQLEHYANGETGEQVLSFFESWDNGHYYEIP